VAGALRVGRGDLDVAVTGIHVVARDNVEALAATLVHTRQTLIDVASSHVVTLLPVSIDGQIAQPTTLAHLLGGVLGPLGRATERLARAYASIDRSPMGAGSLASSGMPIDRERVAELLGFAGLVPNTFDAVAGLDVLAELAEVAAAAVRPIRRWLEELLAWTRIDPALLSQGQRDAHMLGDLPQLRLPGRLLEAIAACHAAERACELARDAGNSLPFLPVTQLLDQLEWSLDEALTMTRRALTLAAELTAEGLDVNRALLANRAGKGFSTSSDLADFLMLEEQIEPGAARDIAALTISRTREQGLEASGITPEIIDGAALLVIGREIKAEFEAISRYLAPRRFIERRTATGSPSPAATRAWLEDEVRRLDADRALIAQNRARIQNAAATLAAVEREAQDVT
jgi:argininosuccinate lyase